MRIAYPIIRYLLLAVLLSISVSAHAVKRALVIGNADYSNETPLANTLNDAQDMRAKLTSMGFVVTGGDNLNLRQMRDQIAGFLYEIEQSTEPALIYYSGHGMQDRHKRSFLLPIDAKIQQEYQIKTQSISLNDILDELKQRPNDAINLVILDACRNNPFASQRGGKGLGRVQPPSGTLVMYAASPDQTAEDNPSERNGLFTKHLLAKLDTPGLDIEDAFEQTAINVRTASRRTQVPYKEGNLLGKFYLAGGPDPRDQPDVVRKGPSMDAELELAFWRSVERAPSKAKYQAYLKKWPKGRFADLAKLHMTEPTQAVVQPPLPPATLAFSVKPTPDDARVRILNIVPRYRDGIELKPGRYHIEISKSGYAKHLHWFDLAQGQQVYAYELDKLPEPQTPPARPYQPSYASTSNAVTAARQSFEPEMVSIRTGCFQMGSPSSWFNAEEDRSDAERQHRVCVDAFQIGKYEVTQAQWRSVMGNNPSGFSGCDTCPVEKVSWDDVQTYITKLNQKTSGGYRLPTEAEWEYAARAGTTGPFSFPGKISADKANYNANYTYAGSAKGRYRKKTMPVGSFAVNPWGLHDVHGNVWEWTCSSYDNAYQGGEQRCGAVGALRAIRGGGWVNYPRDLRSAYRLGSTPGYRINLLGFRLARTSN